MTRPEMPRARAMGAATLLSMVAWGALAAAALHASSNDSAIERDHTAVLRSALILPQGWKFFTKSPREPQLRVLALGPGGWRSAELGANAEPSNWLGLSKAPRARGAELGLISKHVPNVAWHPCSETVEACLARLSEPAVVHNPAPAPSLCGTLAFALQEPVPWAWAALKSKFAMPSRVARLEVSC